MLNGNDLSVLLHATTGDDIFDRTYDAMWLGKRVRKFGDGGQQVDDKNQQMLHGCKRWHRAGISQGAPRGDPFLQGFTNLPSTGSKKRA